MPKRSCWIKDKTKLDIAISLLTKDSFNRYSKKVERLEKKAKRKRQTAINVGEADAKAFRATRCEKDW